MGKKAKKWVMRPHNCWPKFGHSDHSVLYALLLTSTAVERLQRGVLVLQEAMPGAAYLRFY